jgi:uncharacterized protein (DUF2225 family)
MTIDEAIEKLKSAKKSGVKNIIAAWWFADQFQREDNDEWAYAAELIERKMDWSATHDDLKSMLDLYTNE